MPSSIRFSLICFKFYLLGCFISGLCGSRDAKRSRAATKERKTGFTAESQSTQRRNCEIRISKFEIDFRVLSASTVSYPKPWRPWNRKNLRRLGKLLSTALQKQRA